MDVCFTSLTNNYEESTDEKQSLSGYATGNRATKKLISKVSTYLTKNQ